MMMTTTKKHQAEKDVSLLPKDIMMLILSKLPRKSLLRSKCVSRAWFHLIHSVCRQYYPAKMSPCNLVIVRQQRHRIHCFSVIHLSREVEKRDVFDLKLPFFLRRSHTGMKILSSNGLVCFSFNEDVRKYAFNPITRHILKLPSVPCYTCNVSFNTGFGYLPRRDEYRIVVWFVQDDLKNISHASSSSSSSSHAAVLGCWVLSLKKNINGTIAVVEPSSSSSWRRLEVDLPPAGVSFSDSFCVNGTVYWLCCCGDEGTTTRAQHLLLSFDLDEEAFQLKTRPSFPISSKMVEIEDCLCVVNLQDHTTFILWEFKNGDYWRVKHMLHDFFCHGYRRLSFLAYTRLKSGVKELVFMADDATRGGGGGGHGRRLLSYNLKSQSFRSSSENLQPLLRDDGFYFLF